MGEMADYTLSNMMDIDEAQLRLPPDLRDCDDMELDLIDAHPYPVFSYRSLSSLMPVTQRIAPGKVAPRKSTKPQLQPGIITNHAHSGLSIPTEVNVPSENFADYVTLLYGSKGIGKTSLAAQNPGSLVLMLEPRRRNLRIRQVPNDRQPAELDWLVLRDYLDLASEDDSVQTVVIDSVDIAYQLCLDQVSTELKVKHPGELDGGRGWTALAREFESTIKAFAASGKALWLTSHARNHTIDEVVAANRFVSCMPTCTPACFKFMKQICDFILYYGHFNRLRSITVRGEGLIETGAGLDDHFLDPEGEPLKTFYVGNSAQAAYEDLLAAFNNQVRDVSYSPPLEETGIARRSVPKKRR